MISSPYVFFKSITYFPVISCSLIRSRAVSMSFFAFWRHILEILALYPISTSYSSNFSSTLVDELPPKSFSQNELLFFFRSGYLR